MNIFKVVSDASVHELRDFLDSGDFSIDQMNEHGYTLLHWAVGLWRDIKDDNSTKCIQMLHDAGFSWDAVMRDKDVKPVHLADSASLLRVLKDMGIDLLNTDNQGRNLMMKDQRDNLEVFETMVDLYGASVLENGDDRGNTVFHYAVQSDKGDRVVSFLLDHKMRWDDKNMDDETPLSLAIPRIYHLILDKQEELELEKLLDEILEDDHDEIALKPKENNAGGMIPCYPGQFDMNLSSQLIAKYPSLLDKSVSGHQDTEDTEPADGPTM
jgi:ankyrin repeat protein